MRKRIWGAVAVLLLVISLFYGGVVFRSSINLARLVAVVTDISGPEVVAKERGGVFWLEFPDIDEAIEIDLPKSDIDAVNHSLQKLLLERDERIRRRAVYAIAETACRSNARTKERALSILLETIERDPNEGVCGEAVLGAKKLKSRIESEKEAQRDPK